MTHYEYIKTLDIEKMTLIFLGIVLPFIKEDKELIAEAKAEIRAFLESEVSGI